jgi:hypothetical protein
MFSKSSVFIARGFLDLDRNGGVLTRACFVGLIVLVMKQHIAGSEKLQNLNQTLLITNSGSLMFP